MTKRITSLVLALVLLGTALAVLTSCDFSTRPTAWTGKYKYDNARKYTKGAASFGADTVRSLDIDWGAGVVLVEHDENVTEVTLRESVYTGKTEEEPVAVAEDEQLYYWHDGNTLRVRYLQSKLGRREVQAKYLYVLLPTGKALDTVRIKTDIGAAEISGITTTLAELSAVSGDVYASDATVEELKLESVSGEVSAYGTFGKASLHTTSGKVYACTNETYSASRLTIGTVSGEVLVDGRANILPGETEIETVSGNVKFQFSYETAYVIDFQTKGSGLYSSQFGEDETQVGNRYTVGTDGGHIAVTTTSGNVSVVRVIER